MNKEIKIILYIPLLLMMFTQKVRAEEIAITEEQILRIGIPSEFSENIITYVDYMNIDKEFINEIIDDNKYIAKYLDSNYKADNIDINEIYEIYNQGIHIMKKLNIDVKIDVLQSEIVVKELINNTTLFRCNINEINKYYDYFMFKGGKEEVRAVFIDIQNSEKTLVEDDDTTNKEINIAKNEEKINEDSSNEIDKGNMIL